METSFHIKLSELNTDFLKALKSLFKKEEDIEISLTVKPSDLAKDKRVKAYFKKLDASLNNVEKGNVISFSPSEFDKMNRKLLSKK